MSDCFDLTEREGGKGLTVDFIDPNGVVVVSARDFDQRCTDGLSLEVSQRLRARTALRQEVARACCQDYFAEALSPLHIEMAIDRLIGRGFRIEERRAP